MAVRSKPRMPREAALYFMCNCPLIMRQKARREDSGAAQRPRTAKRRLKLKPEFDPGYSRASHGLRLDKLCAARRRALIDVAEILAEELRGPRVSSNADRGIVGRIAWLHIARD